MRPILNAPFFHISYKSKKVSSFWSDTIFVKAQKKMPKLLDKIFYTGYPNNTGPLTLGGRIAGFSDSGFIYIDSYAWTGSSGAGVFDQDGNLIGIIDVANEIGLTTIS